MNKPHSTLGPRWGAWVPPVVWAAILFGLSSIPGSRLPSVDVSFGDKIAHVCVYAMLGILGFRALQRTTSLGPAKTVVAGALITLAFGISDEIHQMFVPMRSPDVLDVVADLMGGSLGALVGHLVARYLSSRRKA